MAEIVIDNLDKTYKVSGKADVHALDHVSFAMNNGIYGLTGHNGAGKSTLINILAGILRPDSGKVIIDGNEKDTFSREYKTLIGFMPQQQWIYENMSCIQFMNYMSALKDCNPKERKRNCNELLDMVSLGDKRNTRISRLSGGMKQRLLFAQALIGNPSLVILDEPTAGVDPEERERLKKLINDNKNDRVFLLSTHILSDVEGFADEIISLEQGRIKEITGKNTSQN